jgi:NADH-quinone oxidoreductase subunit M
MILSLIFLILLLSIIFVAFTPFYNRGLILFIGLLSSSVVLILSTILLITFNFNQYYFQYLTKYNLGLDFLNINLLLGLDGLSIFFFYLSSFLIFLCVLFIWKESGIKEYVLSLITINLLLLLVFSTLDLFFFYIFFEGLLIPMYLLIGTKGSRERKIRAVYLFFFYTLIGSFFMLLGLLYIYSVVGSLNFEYLLCYSFSFDQQYWLWLAFFFSFASKVPLFPFHIWLPEAHVEAPTIGSVLLAGILLKLGVYGFLRFNLSLFPEASLYFSPLIYTLSLFGVVYASLTAIRQMDLKRVIAYSSVAHMNLIVLGIFSFNIIGIEGSIVQSISHGFVSGAMFLLIGVLYDRYHSRFLYYYGGLTHMTPLYASIFLIFTFSNIALPGTSSFVGEFLLLCGIYQFNIISCFFACTSVILCGAYSLWVYNRIAFGNLKTSNTIIFKDLDLKEFTILFPLILLVFLMGIYPKFFINYLTLSSTDIYSIYLF